LKKTVRLFALLFACMSCLSCSVSLLPEHKQMENYGFRPGSMLVERVAPPPLFLLEELKRLDGRSDYLPYIPTAADMQQLNDYLLLLPPRERAAMVKRLAGIYFVTNLSSGGFSDYVYDKNGTLHTILVLNPALFKTGISQWVKDKELSAFLDDRADIGLEVDCGEEGRSALLYILLHESAHQLDYVAGCTPYVEKDLAKSGKLTADVPFVARTWLGYEQPLPRYDFIPRARLHFYGSSAGPRLSRSELPAAYAGLAVTPFNLLYGSQNWAEDFAETVAFSNLKRIAGKDCRIRVTGPGHKERVVWLTDRKPVAERMQYLYNSCVAVTDSDVDSLGR